MTSGTGAAQVPKSAFLDTNALINLFCFWEACNAAGAKPDSVAGWSALKAALKGRNKFAADLNSDDASAVSVGMRCFQNLSNSSGIYQYYSSMVCRSEMHHVILESLGMERLVRRRIPHSLRVKRPQVLYRRALQSRDYRNLRGDLDGFFESLKLDYGIDIVEVEEHSAGTSVTSDDIWGTAHEVWSRILLDVMDSYIYAAAIEIEADAFVTSDNSLVDALNNLYSPSGEWLSLVRSLKRSLGKPASASLPRPMRPGVELPQ